MLISLLLRRRLQVSSYGSESSLEMIFQKSREEEKKFTVLCW
jgi:hypothetical protein